jgi:hypothetical protein
MEKTVSYVKLLALLSGVSVLSFGSGYLATLHFEQYLSQNIGANQSTLLQKKLSGLPLDQVSRTLGRASFKFLTTSAYSLVDTTNIQPIVTDGAGEQAYESDFANSQSGNS